MIFPYSHKFALVQMPVPYYYKDKVFQVYPLRLRDVYGFDLWLQGNVVKEYVEQIPLLPPEEQEEFKASFAKVVAGVSFSTEVGSSFVWKSVPSLTHYAALLLRNAIDEGELRKMFFPSGFSEESATVIKEMEASVTRPLPPQEKLKIVEKKPRYASTPEEDEARVYHFLATKFSWTYNDILDMTEYQIAWYCHLYPEDREHYEYLDELSRKRNEIVSNAQEEAVSNGPPGTIHFNSPEAYEQWKREREQNKKR